MDRIAGRPQSVIGDAGTKSCQGPIRTAGARIARLNQNFIHLLEPFTVFQGPQADVPQLRMGANFALHVSSSLAN